MPQLLLSPIGPIHLRAAGEALAAIAIGGSGADDAGNDPVLREAAAQIAAWFAGRLTVFDLPLAPPSTPRGATLRAALCSVGHGETASYGEVARRAGSGPRAIGQACARNPLPIVVPCHRIVARGGAPGHYSAGEGIATKLWLLDFERGGGRG